MVIFKPMLPTTEQGNCEETQTWLDFVGFSFIFCWKVTVRVCIIFWLLRLFMSSNLHLCQFILLRAATSQTSSLLRQMSDRIPWSSWIKWDWETKREICGVRSKGGLLKLKLMRSYNLYGGGEGRKQVVVGTIGRREDWCFSGMCSSSGDRWEKNSAKGLPNVEKFFFIIGVVIVRKELF